MFFREGGGLVGASTENDRPSTGISVKENVRAGCRTDHEPARHHGRDPARRVSKMTLGRQKTLLGRG
jgi:hypothetical protein